MFLVLVHWSWVIGPCEFLFLVLGVLYFVFGYWFLLLPLCDSLYIAIVFWYVQFCVLVLDSGI